MREAPARGFRQSDVTRVVRAARNAGMDVGGFDLDIATGKITVFAKDVASTPTSAFDKWKARHAD